jgi:hypothetical protein
MATANAANTAANAAVAAERAKFWSNPYALMMEPLPVLNDISSKGGTSSELESVVRRDIPVVKEALDFKKKQTAYTLSIKPEFEQREDVMKYSEGVFVGEVRTVVTEIELFAILSQVVYVVLGRLIPEIKTASPRMAGSSVDADAASYIISTKEIVVLHEIKREKWVFDFLDMALCCHLAGGTDLPRGVKHALEALQHLIGCMVIAECRFGILTSYQHFWAGELCDNGDILVSPAYSSVTRGENSVMSMLCYVIHTALNSKTSGKKFIPPLLERIVDKDPSPEHGVKSLKTELKDSNVPVETKDNSMSETSNHWSWHPTDGFKCLLFLVDQTDRITIQVRLGDGRLAVVKAFDTAIDRDIEVNCYSTLKMLQLVGSIPKLFNGDLKLNWPNPDERRVHALVLEWVGPPNVKGWCFEPPPLPDAALVRLRKILEQMHECGVAHGDVRSPNVMYDSSTGRVTVLDFGHSCTHVEQRFLECCQQDLRSVDLL